MIKITGYRIINNTNLFTEENMEQKKKSFSIKQKLYIFVAVTLFVAAFGISAISFFVEADQIDRYYKQNTADNARNFASMVDGDYLKKLRDVAASDEAC